MKRRKTTELSSKDTDSEVETTTKKTSSRASISRTTTNKAAPKPSAAPPAATRRLRPKAESSLSTLESDDEEETVAVPSTKSRRIVTAKTKKRQRDEETELEDDEEVEKPKAKAKASRAKSTTAKRAGARKSSTAALKDETETDEDREVSLPKAKKAGHPPTAKRAKTEPTAEEKPAAAKRRTKSVSKAEAKDTTGAEAQEEGEELPKPSRKRKRNDEEEAENAFQRKKSLEKAPLEIVEEKEEEDQMAKGAAFAVKSPIREVRKNTALLEAMRASDDLAEVMSPAKRVKREESAESAMSPLLRKMLAEKEQTEEKKSQPRVNDMMEIEVPVTELVQRAASGGQKLSPSPPRLPKYKPMKLGGPARATTTTTSTAAANTDSDLDKMEDEPTPYEPVTTSTPAVTSQPSALSTASKSISRLFNVFTRNSSNDSFNSSTLMTSQPAPNDSPSSQFNYRKAGPSGHDEYFGTLHQRRPAATGIPKPRPPSTLEPPAWTPPPVRHQTLPPATTSVYSFMSPRSPPPFTTGHVSEAQEARLPGQLRSYRPRRVESEPVPIEASLPQRISKSIIKGACLVFGVALVLASIVGIIWFAPANLFSNEAAKKEQAKSYAVSILREARGNYECGLRADPHMTLAELEEELAKSSVGLDNDQLYTALSELNGFNEAIKFDYSNYGDRFHVSKGAIKPFGCMVRLWFASLVEQFGEYVRENLLYIMPAMILLGGSVYIFISWRIHSRQNRRITAIVQQIKTTLLKLKREHRASDYPYVAEEHLRRSIIDVANQKDSVAWEEAKKQIESDPCVQVAGRLIQGSPMATWEWIGVTQ